LAIASAKEYVDFMRLEPIAEFELAPSFHHHSSAPEQRRS